MDPLSIFRIIVTPLKYYSILLKPPVNHGSYPKLIPNLLIAPVLHSSYNNKYVILMI